VFQFTLKKLKEQDKSIVGEIKEYCIATENCNMFTIEYLKGRSSVSDNIFTLLKRRVKRVLNNNTW
jgi:hypothetical protein